jgi:hypothetical protein
MIGCEVYRILEWTLEISKEFLFYKHFSLGNF